MKKLFLPIMLFAFVAVSMLLAFSPKNYKNEIKTNEIDANEISSTNNLVWVTNYKEAVKKAKKEKKRLLLNFTGSDWCGWCIRLDKEVFGKADFVKYANQKLVCVKLDFPRKKQLSQAEQTQNYDLQTKYNVEGYPTVLLLDSNESLLLSTGYQAGGAKKYIEHLESSARN